MFEFVTELFDTTGFVPRRNCGDWTSLLIWLHVGGDLFIWLAYITIPLVLLYFTHRRHLPYPRLFILFALFILACGFGHLIEALMFDYPLYRLAGAWKVVTAVVSWATVFALISVIQRAMQSFDKAAHSASSSVTGPASVGDTTLHRLAKPLQRDLITDYIVAVLAGVLALLLRAAVDPVVDSDHVYVLSLLAVVFISWRSGFGPGIVTLVVSMLGMIFFFVGRRYTIIVEGFGNQLATAMFFFCGVCCAGLGEAQRRARLATKTALAVALDRKAELETEMALRREAEEAIRESEGRFRSMADSAPAMIWLSDLDQRRTYFNRTWLAFTGRSLNQELGKGWIESIHPDDCELYLGAYTTAISVRKAFEVEYRLRRYDGIYRWVLARGTPRFTPSGAFAGFVGLCLDVTDRKQAEEAVARSEKNLADFFENANVGLHWVGSDGTVLRANQAELELLGFSREEYVGRHISEFHADGDVIADILTRLKKGERLDNFPARMRRKDGAIRDVLISSTVLWEDGRFVHSRCFTRDVTELKQGAEDLRRSEARYRTLTEAIPQMVWNAGADGEVSYFNQRWQEYTGVPIEQAAGRGWLNAVYPDDTERLYLAWQQTVQNNPGVADRFTHEFRLRRAYDGAFRWMLSIAVPLHRPDGTVDQWIGSMADIDDQKRQAENLERTVRDRTIALKLANEALVEEIDVRKRAEEQVRAVAAELARSNSELEQFAYVASHDLQEPLRKIQAFGDRLKIKVRDNLPELGKEYVDRMLTSAGRMRRLIDDLLSFSRVTSQARPFVRVNLEKIAREVVADLSERIEETHADVRVEELPEIDADPTQMRQLLQNLIVNAVKFQRPGVPPVVEVSGELVSEPASTPEGEPITACQIRVRDSGIGFDEKYLDRIFQVFQRLHGRDEFEGTGVGLAICRKILERHGGAITAQSRIGEGTTFVVTLPFRQTYPADAALSNPAGVRPGSEDVPS